MRRTQDAANHGQTHAHAAATARSGGRFEEENADRVHKSDVDRRSIDRPANLHIAHGCSQKNHRWQQNMVKPIAVNIPASLGSSGGPGFGGDLLYCWAASTDRRRPATIAATSRRSTTNFPKCHGPQFGTLSTSTTSKSFFVMISRMIRWRLGCRSTSGFVLQPAMSNSPPAPYETTLRPVLSAISPTANGEFETVDRCDN